MWNFRTLDELEKVGMGWLGEGSSEQPGYSAFLRDGDAVFHTYSMYARGAESLGGSYYFLDTTRRDECAACARCALRTDRSRCRLDADG